LGGSGGADAPQEFSQNLSFLNPGPGWHRGSHRGSPCHGMNDLLWLAYCQHFNSYDSRLGPRSARIAEDSSTGLLLVNPEFLRLRAISRVFRFCT
jgi:hypothetical protein